MSIRLPPIRFSRLEDAWRDLSTILAQSIRDDAKPPRWDDVWMLGNSVASAGNPKAPVFDFGEYAYRFTASHTGLFAGAIQMPHRMKIDGIVVGVPHLHLYSRTAASTTTSAKHVWRLRWRWYSAVGVQSASWNVRTVTFTNTGISGQMFIASFGTVTASVTVGTSSIFKFEIAKLPPGGNRIYYMDQADTHVLFDVGRGSRLETQKWET